MRKPAVILVLVHLLVLLLAACAGSAARPTLRGLSPKERAGRLALGALEVTRAPETIAAWERAHGNRDEALRAMHLHLAQARVARALGGGVQAWKAAQVLAVEYGDVLGDPQLVLAAFSSAPAAGDQLRPAFLRAAGRTWAIFDQELYDAAWAASAGDAAARASLARQRMWDRDVPTLSDDELRVLGVHAIDLMDHALDLALSGGDRARMRAAAELLVGVDPWDVRGRLVLLLLDDLAAARVDDPRLLADLGNRDTEMAIARLELTRRAHPGAGVTLALAYRYLAAGLHGDALVLVDELVAAGGLPAAARDVAGALRALAAIHGADMPSWRAWADRHHGDDSAFFTRELARITDAVPAALRDEARRARLRVQDRGLGMPRWELTTLERRIAGDDAAPHGARRAALAALAGLDWEVGVVAGGCLAQRVTTAVCDERLRALDVVREAEEDEAEPEDLGKALATLLDAARAMPDLPSGWLWSVSALPAAELRALAPALAGLAGTRLAATEPFVLARLLVDVARGDAPTLQERLAVDGAVLAPRVRLWFRLAARDLAAHRIDGDGAIAAHWYPMRVSALRVPDDADDADDAAGAATDDTASDSASDAAHDAAPRDEPANELARLGRALTSWWEGHHRVAAADLAVLAAVLPADEGAELRAWIAIAALIGGDVAAAKAEHGRVRRGAPGSEADAVVARELGGAAALQAAEDVLRRDPDSWTGRGSWLHRLAVDVPGSEGARRAAAFLRATNDDDVTLTALDAHAIRDGATLARWLDARRDGEIAVALGATGSGDAQIVRMATSWLDRHVRAAPAELRIRAAAAAAYLRLVRDAGRKDTAARDRAHLAWFQWLAGDVAAASGALVGEDALDPWHPLALLVARRELLDDALATAVWRYGVGDRLEDDARSSLAQQLLARVPDDAAVAEVACRLLDRAPAQMAAPCLFAWEHGRIDADLAAAVTFLAAAHADELRARQVDASAVFAAARRALGDVGGEWRHNEAAWYRRAGHPAEAAAAELEAWAHGYDPGWEGYYEDEIPELAHRGPSLRHQVLRANGDGTQEETLAWLALLGGDVAAAGVYAAAAERRGALAAEARADLAALDRDLVQLAVADLAAKRLDRAGVARTMALITEARAADIDALRSAYPDSDLVTLVFVDQSPKHLRMVAGITAGLALLARHPDNVTLAVDVAGMLVLQRRYAEARAAIRAAKRTRGADARLGKVAIPAGADGEAPTYPKLARDVAAWDRAVAAVDDAAIARLAPVSVVKAEVGIAAALPGGWSADARFPVGMSSAGLFAAISADPRASHCQGMACLDLVAPQLTASGFELLWRRELTIPAGAATEGMFAAGAAIMDVVLVPSGGRLYALFYGGKPERFGEEVAVARLLREGFRPLDRLVSGARAEQLLAGSSIGEALRLAAWRELAAPAATGCPIPAAWSAAADDGGRAMLLRDLYLAAAPAQRTRLLSCAAPEAAAAAQVAVLALIDEEVVAHAWGVAAVAHWPDEALAAAQVLFMGERGTALAGEDATMGHQPAHGALEVLAALPSKQRAALADALAASVDPGDHALALTASHIAPGALAPARLRELIRTGSPKDARLAEDGLTWFPDADDMTAVRDRFDGMTPRTPEERALYATLAGRIFSQVDARDAKRLTAAAKRLAAAAKQDADLEGLAYDIDVDARAHARALALVAGGKPVAKRDFVERVAQRLARFHTSRGTARLTAAALRDTPLAALLPGEDWEFVRLAQPALFSATARGLFARLGGATDTDAAIARRTLSFLADQEGGALLAEENGLDLTRPIECASATGTSHDGFACTAYVKDADAVRRVLQRREIDEDAGLLVPLHLAETAFQLPMSLTAAPLLLRSMMHMPDAPRVRPTRAPTLIEERVRTVRDIGGIAFEYMAIVLVKEQRAAVDQELYRFDGDRLIVFSDPHFAALVLAGPPARGKALADSARFARLTAGWSGGGGVQAVTLMPANALRGDTACDIVADATGIRVRYVTAAPLVSASIDEVDALLPDDPVARVAWAREDTLAMIGYGELAGAKDGPPNWLLLGETAHALGWYPAPGDALWARWVLVVALDKATRKALTTRGWKLPAAGTIEEHDGLSLGLRSDLLGDLLIVGAPRALVEAAMARTTPTTARAGRARVRIAAGRIDGVATAAVVAGLAHGLRDADPRRGTLANSAVLVGAAREVAFTAWQDPKTRTTVIEAEVRPNLLAAGVDTAIVDQWLASKEIRNSARLPRPITHEALAKPLTLLLEVDDAAAFVASELGSSPRLTASVVDDQHVKLIIAPGPGLDDAVAAAPLAAADRARLLGRAEAPEILALAREIVPAGATPAEAAKAVVAWLKLHLTYEITPTTIDAPAIVRRARGDCTEYSTLAAALLRAAGVPAELREGMAADQNEIVAHAWVAFHDGTGWREIEPTWGYTFVDAGHLETSVYRFIALVSLGGVKVVGLETEEP